MNMLFWEREYFSKDVVKVSAPQWLRSEFYQGCTDLYTPDQKWVWNSPVQIGLRRSTEAKFADMIKIATMCTNKNFKDTKIVKRTRRYVSNYKL